MHRLTRQKDWQSEVLISQNSLLTNVSQIQLGRESLMFPLLCCSFHQRIHNCKNWCLNIILIFCTCAYCDEGYSIVVKMSGSFLFRDSLLSWIQDAFLSYESKRSSMVYFFIKSSLSLLHFHLNTFSTKEKTFFKNEIFLQLCFFKLGHETCP